MFFLANARDIKKQHIKTTRSVYEQLHDSIMYEALGPCQKSKTFKKTKTSYDKGWLINIWRITPL